MLDGGSAADPPDHPVLVEAVPEFAQCGVELCDRPEAPQPYVSMMMRHSPSLQTIRVTRSVHHAERPVFQA